INTLAWDEALLAKLDIPLAMLPEVKSSSEVYAYTGGNFFRGHSIPIAGVAGDQHAALFGQACFEPGMAKNTYGTGSFTLVNTGRERVSSDAGLVSTIAWGIGGEVLYALEGSNFSTGATIQWLKEGLGIIGSASEVEALAASVPDNGGVYFVPAFTGLGSPYWDMYARGTIVGLTRGSTKAHIARAALESCAYQTKDVVEAMARDSGLNAPLLRVDGGGAANRMLMQFQSDVLGIPIERSAVAETTALGAAYLAGLAIGFWNGKAEIAAIWESDATFEPSMDGEKRDALYSEWLRAVERAKGWAAR
ncbi:MAG: FGGY family carbohydrate kinase, partial [Ardenticatenaceae bacterium]